MKLRDLSNHLKNEIKLRNKSVIDELKKYEYKPILNEGYYDSRLFLKKGRGAYVEDYSGNKYIDTALGAGTHILGHAHPKIVEAIETQAQNGTLYINPNIHAIDSSVLLRKAIPHLSSFVFCNSGTEATMRAARIARAHTGREKIAFFGGGWHGGNDFYMFDEDYNSPENLPEPVSKSAGVPNFLRNHIILLPFNNEAAFDIIAQRFQEIAMVIVEPSQGSNPRADLKNFLLNLRNITYKYGIILCFDEIITGFRITYGGCQEYYGIEADLATYGKTIASGISIGLLGGKRHVMESIHNNSEKKSVFLGGTFSANPLISYVSKVLLQYLHDNRESIYPYLSQQGNLIIRSINHFCKNESIPVRMYGIESMMRIIFTDEFIKSRRQRDLAEVSEIVQRCFQQYLLIEKGVNVNSSGLIFISTAHKEQEINQIINAISTSLDVFKDFFLEQIF